MAIGNWGTEIVFRVSEREALLLQNLSRTVTAEWAKHSRIGLKDQSEFIRPGLQQVTFTMVLDATLGIRPRATIERLEAATERGEVNTLVIGGRRVGHYRWKITNQSETWETLLNGGELLRASVSVAMEEYL